MSRNKPPAPRMALSPADVRELIRTMRATGVPLLHAVPFLLRARGYKVTEVVQMAGYATYGGFCFSLYSNRPSGKARQVVSGILGLDPWDFYDYVPSEQTRTATRRDRDDRITMNADVEDKLNADV